MPLTTETLLLPYPEHPDPADVPVDVKALVDRLEELGIDSFFQPGDLKITACLEPRDGWLVCDGSWYPQSHYQRLFDAIGTAYGAGPGQDTFQVPDFRGRVPMGGGPQDGNETLRRVPGQRVGAATHRHDTPPATLQASVLPHRHGLSTVRTANHRHGLGSAFVIIPSLGIPAHAHPLGDNGWAWTTAYTTAGGFMHWVMTQLQGRPVPTGSPSSFRIRHQSTPVNGQPMLNVEAYGPNQWPSSPERPQVNAPVAYLGGQTQNSARQNTEQSLAGVSGTTDEGQASLTGQTDDSAASISGTALGGQTSEPSPASAGLPPSQVINVWIKT